MNIDYGCQRVFIYMTSHEFAKILHDDVLGTICCPPSNYPGIEPFTLGLAMTGRTQAIELAEILRVWCKSTTEGDGIFLAILRNKEGHYRVQLGPDLKEIQDRYVNSHIAKLISAHIFGMFHSKLFDDMHGGPSRNFPVFLERWTGQPIRLAMFVEGYPYPLEVPEARIDNVPLRVINTDKNIYLQDEGEETLQEPGEVDHSPGMVSNRRTFALRRYFPVTLARLESNPEFTTLTQQLQDEGFYYWQIIQAACNLTLRQRFQNHSEARSALNRRDSTGVIQALERFPELVTQPLPKLKFIRLRNQVIGDARDFHQNITRDKGLSSAQIQEWIQSSDFRNADVQAPLPADWSFR